MISQLQTISIPPFPALVKAKQKNSSCDGFAKSEKTDKIPSKTITLKWTSTDKKCAKVCCYEHVIKRQNEMMLEQSQFGVKSSDL